MYIVLIIMLTESLPVTSIYNKINETTRVIENICFCFTLNVFKFFSYLEMFKRKTLNLIKIQRHYSLFAIVRDLLIGNDNNNCR